MADHPAPSDRPILMVWQRIRSGEDQLAFGAVLAVVAVAAGLFWFWAGGHRGGFAAASASTGRPTGGAGSPGEAPGGRRAADAGQPRAGTGGGAPPAAELRGAAPAETTGRTLGDGGAEAAGRTGGGAPAPGAEQVAVHVAGAVLHPGLYHLASGSRVADAVAMAGGGVARADLDRLNLAARLIDGQRVYVVRRGEPGLPDPAAGLGATGASGPGVGQPAEPIDLNAADVAALDSLPGIGPATAQAILEQRTRQGGFRSTRDLLRVPGIGEARFARLKDRVRV